MAEIKFRRDTSFRKALFSPDSFAHPAKMDAQLLLWLIEHYSKPGETILDPMAGSGTAMIGCTVGRNIVQVELEQKFVERHYRKLPAQSFWRVIYQQKYPDAPVLDKEDILVFCKLELNV